jgi:ketosteroid isomerase-like protein
MSMSASGFKGTRFDVGPYERVELALTEVDAQGRCRRAETFAVDRLSDAIVRLYERHAELLPDGPERARAAATARSVEAMTTMAGNAAAAIAPTVEAVDHRTLGTWSAHGAEALFRHFAAWYQLVDQAAVRDEHVLALRPDAMLTRRTHSGIDRAGGGAYERQFLVLLVFGADGLVTRIEWFDPDRDAEALARFDALTAARARAAHITNAATRLTDEFAAAWAGRDWEAIAAQMPPDYRHVDRRGYAQMELDRDRHLESLRFRFEMPSSRIAIETLATRGHRLALTRQRFELAGGDVGPSESVSLIIVESDERGELIEGLVSFDPDEVDAAYAELDARYASGEAAPFARTLELRRTFLRALEARDWDTLAGLHAPDLIVNDHRPLGWETLDGRALVESFKSLVDIAPDVRNRADHVTVSDRANLIVFTWIGTREGGPFEITKISVGEIDGAGKYCSYDVYDLEQLDEARRRFDAINAQTTAPDPLAALARPNAATAADPLCIPANAATRANEHWIECVQTRDWNALRVLVAPVVWEDRRRLIRTTGDCEMVVANAELMSRGKYQPARTLLATAGDRLMLQHLHIAGAVGGGDYEIEALEIIEVDAAGRFVASIMFDPEDRRAASTELLERYARVAGWPEWMIESFRAVNAHDLDGFRAGLADDFVFDDHRRTGVGRIDGADAYVASIRPLFEGAPDFFTDNLYVVAEEPRGFLSVARTFGTLTTGGEFESVFVRLAMYRDGRMVTVEQFELEDLDVARARFEELRTASAA